MKISNISILLIIATSLICSCSNSLSELENEYWNYATKNKKFGNFISYAANFPNSEKVDSCFIYMDSLLKIKPNIGLSCGYALDSINNKVLINFMDLAEFDYYIMKRNAFVITLADSGLYHNGKTINKERFLKILKAYHKNLWEDDVDYPQSRKVRTKYFGTILVSAVHVIIETDKFELKDIDSINWNQYLKTILLVKESYFEIWDERANLVWDKDFYDLEPDKQETIMNTALLGMEINFTKRIFGQGEL